MENKICVITGACSGIGLETAKALSDMGATIVLVCRDEQNGLAAREEIVKDSGNKKVNIVPMNLSSQKQIREGIRTIMDLHPKIDVLINNAGTWFSKLEYTEDNIETQFAVNHLAYFLITYELLPILRKSDDPRIINVGSDSHFHGKIHFHDINLTKKYHGLRAHAQSKLANVLFTYEFDRRKDDNKLSIYCVQPGLVKTDIGLKHTYPLHGIAWKLRRLGGVSIKEGAATSIYLASSPDAQGESGKYWDKCKVKKSSRNSYDKDMASRLWLLSEKLCDIENYFGSN
ncbi:SDR family oxidoreductase [Bacteroidota bacterium]